MLTFLGIRHSSFSRVQSETNFEDFSAPEDEDDPTSWRSQRGLGLEVQSALENRISRLLDSDNSATECSKEACDFYSQLQELKRANMEKLQQVIFTKKERARVFLYLHH